MYKERKSRAGLWLWSSSERNKCEFFPWSLGNICSSRYNSFSYLVRATTCTGVSLLVLHAWKAARASYSSIYNNNLDQIKFINYLLSVLEKTRKKMYDLVNWNTYHTSLFQIPLLLMIGREERELFCTRIGWQYGRCLLSTMKQVQMCCWMNSELFLPIFLKFLR